MSLDPDYEVEPPYTINMEMGPVVTSESLSLTPGKDDFEFHNHIIADDFPTKTSLGSAQSRYLPDSPASPLDKARDKTVYVPVPDRNST